MSKTLYRYEIGTGSWHQRKAGNYVSSVLVAEHTPEEHERFMAAYKARGETVVPRTAASGVCPHCGLRMLLTADVGAAQTFKVWTCSQCQASYPYK